MAKFVTPRLQLLSAAAGAAGARPMDATDLGYFEGDHPALRGRLARTLVCRCALPLHRAGTLHRLCACTAQPSDSIARSHADSSVTCPPRRPPAGPIVPRRRRSHGRPGDPGRRMRGQHPPLGRRRAAEEPQSAHSEPRCSLGRARQRRACGARAHTLGMRAGPWWGGARMHRTRICTLCTPVLDCRRPCAAAARKSCCRALYINNFT